MLLNQPRGQEFSLENEFFGKVIVEVDEEFALGDELGAPFVAVELHSSIKILFGKVFHAIGVEVFVIRCPTDLSFVACSSAGAAFHNPFEDPHVFTKAGPHEFSFGGFAEPIDVEEAGDVGEVTLHF